MAAVRFTVTHEFAQPADAVFAALVDWRGHPDWVPLTRVRVEAGAGGPGTVFVATTGVGPLALPDRMRVQDLDAQARTVHITKIGPVLSGTVTLTVTPTPDGCRLEWAEDIRMPGLPRLLAGPVTAATRVGFTAALTRLGRHLASSGPR